MLVAALLIGGLVGFGNFIIALTYFKTGFFLALVIYSLSGIAITLFIVAAANVPPLQRARRVVQRTREI